VGDMSEQATVAGPRFDWRRYIPALPATLAVLAAGGAFQRVFTWNPLPGPLVVAAVLGSLAGVLAREMLSTSRRPFVHSYVLAPVLIVAAMLASTVVAVAVFASPSATSISQGPQALIGGWSHILTTSVPVPPTPDRLPLAAGLVALGAGWAVVAATRRPPGVDALAPAGLVLVIGLLLGVGGPGSLVVVAGPPLVLAAAYLLIVARPAGEGAVWVPPGRVLAATFTAAVVLVVGLSAGDRLPGATLRQPVNLRAALSPPVDLSNAADPLDELPAWQRETKTVMFTASVDQAWLNAPSNWRLISLDTYDGAEWTSAAEATRAGDILSLPSGQSAALLGPEVHVAVHLKALPGPWVPTTGVPTGVTPAVFDFDPATSILVSSGTEANQVFDLAGRLPQPSANALNGAGLASGESVAALTQVPSCFPASLRSLASKATARLGRPDQDAVAIEQELATTGGFHLDAAATPGSNCARLSAMAQDHVGTQEQFATAFALMVRSVGLPSRLAVGFTPGAIDRASKQTVVSAADVTVWPEVNLGPLGWVAFDPVPAARHGSSATGPTKIPAAEKGLAQVRQSVAQAQSSPTTVPTSTPARHARPQSNAGSGIPWPLFVLGGLVVAVVALILARIVARRRRRGRRRATPEPTGSVLGAWAEVLDALAPYRMPLSGLTPSEVSIEAGKVVPSATAPSRQLATIVDQAVYGGIADDGLASQAWACSDFTVRAVAKALPPRQKIGALLLGSRPRPANHRAQVPPVDDRLPPRMQTGAASAVSPPTPYTAPTTKQ
jgi:Transglutaminase-like superfamily/TgpA N-terminal domain